MPSVLCSSWRTWAVQISAWSVRMAARRPSSADFLRPKACRPSVRAQLKAKKMSQRQLAQQSGVDRSTISRLIRGDRMPSLGTATKLARGLRELHDDADAPAVLGVVSRRRQIRPPASSTRCARTSLLTEPQVRQVMEYYLAVRMRPVRPGRSRRPPPMAGRASAAAPTATVATATFRARARARWARPRATASARRARRLGSARRARSSARRRGPPVATSSSRLPFLDFPGHDPDRPPRPGLGDSECRPSGRHSHSRWWRGQRSALMRPICRVATLRCSPDARPSGCLGFHSSVAPCISAT